MTKKNPHRDLQSASKPSRGFTFTISVVIIAATIIAIAAFASEWRRSQEEASSSILPILEAARIEKRVATDMADLLGTGSKIEQNSTEVAITLESKLPLSREGLPIADLSAYSKELQRLYLELSPFEVSVSAPDIQGKHTTVLLLPAAANVTLDNNGPLDTITYSFVTLPKKISLTLYCEKPNGNPGTPTQSNWGGFGDNHTYSFNFTAVNGTAFLSGLTSAPNGQVYYFVDYPELTNFTSNSTLAVGGGKIILTLTKSPSSRLVLPLDENASTAAMGVRDYSRFESNFSVGNLTAAPKWISQCHSGGCYSFDGNDDTLMGANLEFESKDTVSQNPNLLENPDFENYSWIQDPQEFTIGPICDDAVASEDSGDVDLAACGPQLTLGSWPHWTIYRPSVLAGHPKIKFIPSTASVQSGDASVVVNTSAGYASDGWLNQTFFVPSNDSGTFTLSFWTHGDGSAAGRYRFSDLTLGTYLQPGGVWTSSSTPISTGASGLFWFHVVQNFTLSSVDHLLGLQFVTTQGAAYHVDNASVRKVPGLNWGFEFSDGGGGLKNWTLDHGGTFTQSASSPKSGAYCMLAQNNVGQPDSYVYTVLYGMKNNTKYSVEFWARSESGKPDSSIRYQLYDVDNDRYLDDMGNWVKTPDILDSGFTDINWGKVVKNFQTLPSNVTNIQMRFVVPKEDELASCVDDFGIQEVGDLTIIAWVNAENSGTNRTILCQYTPSSASRSGFGFSLGPSGNATMSLYSSSENGYSDVTPDMASPNISIYNNYWHHLALSINRTGNYSAYLDGALFDTGRLESLGIGTINSTAPFYIGACGSNTSFNGSVDDVRVYHRALSAPEIYNLYRDRMQDVCSVHVTLTYDRSSGSPFLSSAYNANLRIRFDRGETELAAHYNFDEGQGNLSHDISGNLAHATLFGGTWDPAGIQSGALYFNGLADRGLTPPIMLGQQFSVSAWVKPNGTQTSFARIAENSLASHFFLGYDASGTRYQFIVRSSSLVGGPLTSGTWQFVVGTFDGSTGTLYVNGTRVANGTLLAPPTVTMPIHIGTSSSFPGTFSFKGIMDDLRVYNRTLSAREVQLLYQDSQVFYDGRIKASSG